MTLQKYTKRAFAKNPIGAWFGMPMADYAKARGKNASSLKLLLESPLTYRRKMDGVLPDRKSKAMETGTVLHAAILEGRLDYHTQPETYGDGKRWNSNANECKAWAEAHADKPILTAAESAFVAESFSYVRQHPIAGRYLVGGKPEVCMFAEIGGTLFKARFDYYRHGCIVDLKTTADASADAFAKQVLQYHWHLQAALYREVACALGDICEFVFIALQKGDLPLVNVLRAGGNTLRLGNERLQQALDLLEKCESNNYWPEWADYDGTNEVKELPLPAWAEPEQEITIGGETVSV